MSPKFSGVIIFISLILVPVIFCICFKKLVTSSLLDCFITSPIQSVNLSSSNLLPQTNPLSAASCPIPLRNTSPVSLFSCPSNKVNQNSEFKSFKSSLSPLATLISQLSVTSTTVCFEYLAIALDISDIKPEASGSGNAVVGACIPDAPLFRTTPACTPPITIEPTAAIPTAPQENSSLTPVFIRPC